MGMRLSEHASYAVLTRVRAQYGARLRETDYLEMASSATVPEAAMFLKERTAYGPYLSLGEEPPTRGLLEFQLRKALLERSVALCRFGQTSGTPFLEYVLLRNSVSELLGFLRCLNANRPERYLHAASAYPEVRSSPFFIAGLAQVHNREELVACLRGTYFESILTPVLRTGETVDLALAEAVLDRSVCAYMQQAIRAGSSHAEAEALSEILLLKAELGDVEMLYRAKTYYDINQTLLRAMLSGYRLHLSKEELNAMLLASDGKEVMRIFLSGTYRKHMQEQRLQTVDSWSNLLLPKLLRRRIHFASEPSVVLFAYLNWLELEIKNLVYVIEGVRYRLPPEETCSLLLLPERERV